MDAKPNICDLSDARLHRYHAEVIGRRRIAMTMRAHFDNQIAELTTTEEAIRAEFDRRFFREFPDQVPHPSDDVHLVQASL